MVARRPIRHFSPVKFLGALESSYSSGMSHLLLRQYYRNRDGLKGNWCYLSILATFTAGESLLKKRYVTCIILAFQRRHFEMYKQYGKTVRIVVTENDHAGLKVLHVHVSVSFAKYSTLTALTIFGHKRGAHEFVEGDRSFWGYA